MQRHRRISSPVPLPSPARPRTRNTICASGTPPQSRCPSAAAAAAAHMPSSASHVARAPGGCAPGPLQRAPPVDPPALLPQPQLLATHGVVTAAAAAKAASAPSPALPPGRPKPPMHEAPTPRCSCGSSCGCGWEWRAEGPSAPAAAASWVAVAPAAASPCAACSCGRLAPPTSDIDARIRPARTEPTPAPTPASPASPPAPHSTAPAGAGAAGGRSCSAGGRVRRPLGSRHVDTSPRLQLCSPRMPSSPPSKDQIATLLSRPAETIRGTGPPWTKSRPATASSCARQCPRCGWARVAAFKKQRARRGIWRHQVPSIHTGGSAGSWHQPQMRQLTSHQH